MDINMINPLVLAYVGDAIYELEIRNFLVHNKINKVNDLQKEAIKYVSAKGQAKFVNKLIENELLFSDELDIYKRARNTKVSSHPANTSIIIYKCATGLEAIFGYLYIKNNMERIKELLKYLEVEI